MLVLAILFAIVVGVIDNLIGIPEPGRKLAYGGVILLFIIGLFQLVFGFDAGLDARGA
jgi:hypothetical protein